MDKFVENALGAFLATAIVAWQGIALGASLDPARDPSASVQVSYAETRLELPALSAYHHRQAGDSARRG